MKIVVCLKQVPDTETRVQIAPEGDRIAEGAINWIVSPYDESAIEEALKIKEAKSGEVVLVTVGPERAQSALRTGLAMGADSAVHVKDSLLDVADTLATARALAGAIKTLEPVDLILCGQQGVGGDNSQIPGLLAELLDLPQVTVAVKIDVQDTRAIVEREIEGAHVERGRAREQVQIEGRARPDEEGRGVRHDQVVVLHDPAAHVCDGGGEVVSEPPSRLCRRRP